MRKQKGIVLIFVLLLVPAIMAAVVGTLYSSQISQYVGRADRDATMAERVAQTGLDQVRTEIFQDARDMVADAANGNADVANQLIDRSQRDRSEAASVVPIPMNDDVPACNLLGHTQMYRLDANEPPENKAKKVGWIPLDRENGGGYGRFEVTLEITRQDAPHLAQGWLTSKGQVLTGLNVDDPNDPLKNYDPSQLYPEVTLSQAVFAHNASLLSHTLITNELDSAGTGFTTTGPIFIAGNQELEVPSDINPGDFWGCKDNDNNGSHCVEGEAMTGVDPNTGVAPAFGFTDAGDDQLMGPLRPWMARDGDELWPKTVYAIDLRDMLAEGFDVAPYDNRLGPLSLCTRVRAPKGQLTGNNSANDIYSVGPLRAIVGAHVGIRPDSGGMPVQATDDPYVIQAGPASGDDLAVLAGFNSQPKLLTPYDLDPILVNQNPAYNDETYTGELRLPDTQGGRGLTDYYSSKGIEGEQNLRTVYSMVGGESGLQTAKDSPAPDGIIISYEWLRVGRDGKKTDFYLKAQGMTEEERNTCAEGIIHPEYKTETLSEGELGSPVGDGCYNPACFPCFQAANLDIVFQVAGLDAVSGAPGAVLPNPDTSADIVWPVYETPYTIVNGIMTGSNTPQVLVPGTGSINPSARYKVPKFDMSKSFQCIHSTRNPVTGVDDWVGMKWKPNKRKWDSDSNIKPWELGDGDVVTGGILEVRGPVTLEGIELPLEDALFDEPTGSFVDSLGNPVFEDPDTGIFLDSAANLLLDSDGNPLPLDAFTQVTKKVEDINHRVEVKGDGLVTLREREIRLIADHQAYFFTPEATCVGVTPSPEPGVPGDTCSCNYSVALPGILGVMADPLSPESPVKPVLQLQQVSLPTPAATGQGAGSSGSCLDLPALSIPGVEINFDRTLCQPPIIPPDAIESHRFATFPHGGKAGYSGPSSNGFTQDLPSLALHRPWMTFYGGTGTDVVTGLTSAETHFDDEDCKNDCKDQGWGKFPQRDIASIPMIVSDPKFPIELTSNRIYAGIIYHDNEVIFKKEVDAQGNPVPEFGPAVLGRVMAPKVTVEAGSQVYGVSGYEYHLNTDFEDWLQNYARDTNGKGFSTEVIKNLPVFNVTSETLSE